MLFFSLRNENTNRVSSAFLDKRSAISRKTNDSFDCSREQVSWFVIRSYYYLARISQPDCEEGTTKNDSSALYLCKLLIGSLAFFYCISMKTYVWVFRWYGSCDGVCAGVINTKPQPCNKNFWVPKNRVQRGPRWRGNVFSTFYTRCDFLETRFIEKSTKKKTSFLIFR